MIEYCINVYNKFYKILTYFIYSVLSTIFDTFVVWLLFYVLNFDLIIANTCGIISGFFLQYFLSIKNVFKTSYGFLSFFVYLCTSVLGLFIANFIITNSYAFCIKYIPEWFAFLLCKALSIIFPFFIMYYLRKKIFIMFERRTHI